jgi:hypothetical protein
VALTDTPTHANRDDVTIEAEAPPAIRPHEPTGAAAAALLAGGAGCTIFGVLVLLTDAIPALHHAMTFSKAVGPLSGKSLVGTVAWLVVWAALHAALAGREISMKAVVRTTGVLIGLGFLLTFPPFFLRFAAA